MTRKKPGKKAKAEAAPPEQLAAAAQSAADMGNAASASASIALSMATIDLGSMFGLSGKLHAHKAADELWAEKVVQHFDGTGLLRPGAKEKLKEWYRIYARPYFQNKFAAKRKAARAKAARARAEREKDQDGIEVEQSEKATRH